MKYKNIKAMAHNFAHSFLSYMNYVDDGYVIDDLLDFARNKDAGQKAVVQFIPQNSQKDVVFNDRIQKSLGHYRQHFPKHCSSHKVDLSAIQSLKIEIVKDSSHQILGYVSVVDDKGGEHNQYVSF